MIRQMQGQDVDAVAMLEQEIFSNPWSKKSFRMPCSQNIRFIL